MTAANIQIKKILVGRGNTAVASAYNGVRGEIVLDTGLNTLRVYDGTTTGGTVLATNQQVLAISNLVANTTIQVGNAPPVTSTTGTLWYDSEGGRTYIRYANAWVDASPAVTDISIIDLTANVAEIQANFAGLIGELEGFTTDVEASIGTLTSNAQTLTSNFNAYRTYANANIGTIITRAQTLSSNLGAFQTYANLKLTNLETQDTILRANIGAYQTYSNANVKAIAVSVRNLVNAGANVAVSPEPPNVNKTGSLWWDSEDGRLYLLYNSSWVDASPTVADTISLTQLKDIVASSGSWSAFQANIAAL
jgi:hypothetical protein